MTLSVSTVFAVGQCLPVSCVGVLYSDGWRYCQTSSSDRYHHDFIFFYLKRWYQLLRGTPSVGHKIHGEWKKIVIFDWNCRLS